MADYQNNNMFLDWDDAIESDGQEFVILSLFHGFLVDFSVPFLVTFFCTL